MIWLRAPSRSHGQNEAGGHGTRSPDVTTTMAKNRSENGKPNRKRILVAPQVPSGRVSERCIALRATWPREATMVKGIQSVVTENMAESLLHPPLEREGRLHRAMRRIVRCGRGGVKLLLNTKRRVTDTKLNAYACVTHAWTAGLDHSPTCTRPSPSRPLQERGAAGSHHLLRDNHVVHVSVGGEAPFVGKGIVD